MRFSILDYFKQKVMTKVSESYKKLFSAFLPILGGKNGQEGLTKSQKISKNQALSLLAPFGSLTLCKRTRKTNEWILRKGIWNLGITL